MIDQQRKIARFFQFNKMSEITRSIIVFKGI